MSNSFGQSVLDLYVVCCAILHTKPLQLIVCAGAENEDVVTVMVLNPFKEVDWVTLGDRMGNDMACPVEVEVRRPFISRQVLDTSC